VLGNWNFDGPGSVTVTWTNWALTGDQTLQVIYQCTGNLVPPPATPTATPQSASTQPTPSPTAEPPASPTAAVSLTDLTVFQKAFSNLPALGGTGHTDPSAGLMPGIQTPPNTAALGRQLKRVYATPQVLKPGQVLTLSTACLSGGLVTADPGVRSALPYISRVTNVNVWSSLASGDVGQSSLGVQFTNKSSYNELAAFQFVCSVPN
jgi:hypothetical protein